MAQFGCRRVASVQSLMAMRARLGDRNMNDVGSLWELRQLPPPSKGDTQRNRGREQNSLSVPAT